MTTYLECQTCGKLEERSQYRDKATCFECKVKRRRIYQRNYKLNKKFSTESNDSL